MTEDYKEIDNILFNDGYKLAESILKDFVSPGGLSRLTETVYANIDELLKAFVSSITNENKKIDCKKSCHWCCTQPVFINPSEAQYILEYMESNFNDSDITEIQSKILEKNNNTKDLSLKEQLLHKEDCPFLKEKSCSIYPARPMACRIYLSMNLQSCISHHNNPESKEQYAKLYDFPLHAGRMLNEGIAAFLRDKKLKVPVLSLESAMNYIITTKDAIDLWTGRKEDFLQPEFSEKDYDDLEKFELNE